jgi:hypothetical protein
MTPEVLSSLSRLERIQAQFDQLCGEILQTLAEGRERSLEGERRMSEITKEAIAQCDKILEYCK